MAFDFNKVADNKNDLTSLIGYKLTVSLHFYAIINSYIENLTSIVENVCGKHIIKNSTVKKLKKQGENNYYIPLSVKNIDHLFYLLNELIKELENDVTFGKIFNRNGITITNYSSKNPDIDIIDFIAISLKYSFLRDVILELDDMVINQLIYNASFIPKNNWFNCYFIKCTINNLTINKAEEANFKKYYLGYTEVKHTLLT